MSVTIVLHSTTLRAALTPMQPMSLRKSLPIREECKAQFGTDTLSSSPKPSICVTHAAATAAAAAAESLSARQAHRRFQKIEVFAAEEIEYFRDALQVCSTAIDMLKSMRDEYQIKEVMSLLATRFSQNYMFYLFSKLKTPSEMIGVLESFRDFFQYFLEHDEALRFCQFIDTVPHTDSYNVTYFVSVFSALSPQTKKLLLGQTEECAFLSSVIPEEFLAMCKSYKTRNAESSGNLHEDIFALHKQMLKNKEQKPKSCVIL